MAISGTEKWRKRKSAKIAAKRVDESGGGATLSRSHPTRVNRVDAHADTYYPIHGSLTFFQLLGD